MIDSYYTPRALADDLITHCRLDAPLRVADFAVGGGSLLSAAHKVWPEADLFGVDLDAKAINASRNAHPQAELFNTDFLSSNEDNRLGNLVGSIDLIVLNPPFSCRSSLYETTAFEDENIKSSKAMAFLLASCRYLSSTGEILAIVPRSCLFSQKDQNARSALSRQHNLEDLGACQSPGFNGASVSVHLVRIGKADAEERLPNVGGIVAQLKPERAYGIAIMRGNHPVALGKNKSDAPSLIHTTDLFNGEISISRLRAVKTKKKISGQVIMMPRVARPNRNKIALGNFIRPVVPSDCILSMKTIPAGNGADLQRQLLRFWSALENAYSGTCASYLTLNALKDFLVSIGYDVTVDDSPSLWDPLAILDPIVDQHGYIER